MVLMHNLPNLTNWLFEFYKKKTAGRAALDKRDNYVLWKFSSKQRLRKNIIIICYFILFFLFNMRLNESMKSPTLSFTDIKEAMIGMHGQPHLDTVFTQLDIKISHTDKNITTFLTTHFFR